METKKSRNAYALNLLKGLLLLRFSSITSGKPAVLFLLRNLKIEDFIPTT